MNTMMMALLQGRLWDAASALQQRLRSLEAGTDEAGEADIARELSQVIHALDALQAGHYGYCSECEQPLEPDQLLLQPHRLRCAGCESHAEVPRFAQRAHLGGKPAPAGAAAAR